MFFILIGGASGSGKTTVATQLVQKLNAEHTKTINLSMDNYYKTANDIEAYLAQKKQKEICYDSMPAFDICLLMQQLTQLEAGKVIQQPIYSHQRSDRDSITETIDPTGIEIIVVEGVLALNLSSLMKDKSHYSIFVESDWYLNYINRRVIRDQQERGRNEQEVRLMELSSVRTAFFNNILPEKKQADWVVTNNNRTEHSKENMFKDLEEMIREINIKRKPDLPQCH